MMMEAQEQDEDTPRLDLEWAAAAADDSPSLFEQHQPVVIVDLMDPADALLMELQQQVESDNNNNNNDNDDFNSILWEDHESTTDMDENNHTNINHDDEAAANQEVDQEESEQVAMDRDIESGLERLGENEESDDDSNDDSDFDNTAVAVVQEERTRRDAVLQTLRLVLRILVFPFLVLVSVAIPVVLVMFCFALMFVALLVLLCVYYCCSPARGSDQAAVPFHVLVRQILEAVDDERNGLAEGSNATPKYAREQIQNAMVRRKLLHYECHDEGGNLVENDEEGASDEATREERMHQDMFPVEPDPSTLTKEDPNNNNTSDNTDDSDKDDEDKEANKPAAVGATTTGGGGLLGRRKRRQLQRKKQKETEAAMNSRNETYNLRLAQRQITFQTDPRRNHSKLFLHRRTYVFSEPLKSQEVVVQQQQDTTSAASVNDLHESEEWLDDSSSSDNNNNNNNSSSIAAAALARRAEIEQQRAANQNSNNNNNDDDSSSSERYYFPMPLFLSDDDDSSSASSSPPSTPSNNNPTTTSPAAPSTASSDVSFLIDDDDGQEAPAGPSLLLVDERDRDTVTDLPTAVIDVETGLVVHHSDSNEDKMIDALPANKEDPSLEDYTIEKDKVSTTPMAIADAVAVIDAIHTEKRHISETRKEMNDVNQSIHTEDDTTSPKPFSTEVSPNGKDESIQEIPNSKGDNLHDEDSGDKKIESFVQSCNGLLGSEKAVHHIQVPFEPDVGVSMVNSSDIEEAKTEISDMLPEPMSGLQRTTPPLYAGEIAPTVRVPSDEDPLEARKTNTETLVPADAAAELSSPESKALALRSSLSFSPDARGTSTCCNICLLEYDIGDIVVWSRRPNGCHHAWHEDCLLDWLKRKPTCPHCRQEFFAIEDSPHKPAALSPGGGVEDNSESEAVHTILPESMHTVPAEIEDTTTRSPSRYWW